MTDCIIIATSNLHKLREFKTILKERLKVDILSLCDFKDYILPEETGTSFEENAVLKALAGAKAFNSLVLADDSGLVVPALKGDPGIHSSIYAGLGASDKENRAKLLRNMNHLKEEQRYAYFSCALALADPTGIKACVTASCEGFITEEEKGIQGFGYDCLFMKHEYGKTFGQLDHETKNRVSHRKKAIDKLCLTLESMGLI
ncbi:MAG: RdgB/HAM1 family non-canonical purine NTP pyrophosphatase [Rhabdochlamydiaceae bacterium]